jgi:hypothetical protein
MEAMDGEEETRGGMGGKKGKKFVGLHHGCFTTTTPCNALQRLRILSLFVSLLPPLPLVVVVVLVVGASFLTLTLALVTHCVRSPDSPCAHPFHRASWQPPWS